jgi:hypothetical protein
MVTPIQSISTGVANKSGSGGDASSVALQAQLERCERQLGDWQACPSSKTPEGKKIIENLRARVGTLEARLAVTPAQSSSATQSRAAEASTARAFLDVFV